MPSLVVIFGRDRGRHFDLPNRSRLTIGRDKQLANRLNDPSISRKHLAFEYQAKDDQFLIVDLMSRNGARINNKRLFKSQVLRDGDIIQVGYTLLVFVCVTFDANVSVEDFLNDCEHQYEPYLEQLRVHSAMHIDHDEGDDSHGGMSGTFHLGHLFGKQ